MKIEYIIIHCSDSNWGSAHEINKWHQESDFKYIGYHFTILNSWPRPRTTIPLLDGSIEVGRNMQENGAHTYGYNSKSLGICLIGKDSFTPKQRENAKMLVKFLIEQYSIPVDNVLGHYEVATDGRTCPNFDMDWFRNYVMTPDPQPHPVKEKEEDKPAIEYLIKFIRKLIGV